MPISHQPTFRRAALQFSSGTKGGCAVAAALLPRLSAAALISALNACDDQILSASSNSLQAFTTISLLTASMDMPSGVQRRQALNPAASAAPVLSCSLTFFRLARHDGHDGRR